VTAVLDIITDDDVVRLWQAGYCIVKRSELFALNQELKDLSKDVANKVVETLLAGNKSPKGSSQ
jgi:hypothetical protein